MLISLKLVTIINLQRAENERDRPIQKIMKWTAYKISSGEIGTRICLSNIFILNRMLKKKNNT